MSIAILMSSAAHQGSLDCLNLLLEHGAEVDVQRHSGVSALMFAAQRGHDACVVALLDAGADPNLSSDRRDTALLWAVGKGHADCVERLIDAGADARAANEQGESSMDLVTRHRKFGGAYLRIEEMLVTALGTS